MKNKLLQLLLLASGSLLLIIAAPPLANAQESSEATTGVATRRTLTGEIRWKKTIGLPSRDFKEPIENACEPFYVLVLDPEQEDKLIWFANALQRGRDSAESYSCKYEIIGVPTNKRLKVIAGMGDPFAKPYGNDKPHWYRGEWVPEGGRKPENNLNALPLPAGLKPRLVFAPSEKYVTLTSKNMWLSFDLFFALVRTKSF